MPLGPAAYQLLCNQIRQRITAFSQATWNGLGSWRDADIEEFVARVTPQVAAGQVRIAALTDAYMAQEVAALFGTNPTPTGLDPDLVSGAAIRNGASPADVYRRPAVDVYSALKKGLPLDVAVQRGSERLAALVETDMQLARTHASREALRNSPATYFRRVLSGAENCALCTIASTQRYKTSELLPIHAHCDCGVAPIKGNSVPHVLDRAQLEEVHSAAERITGETQARSGRGEVDYRQIMVVNHHGEYGPVLSYRGQHFDGPADIHT